MYASIENLEKRLVPATLLELTDDNGDGVADTDVLEAALADADAEIDLFLGARHVTPLADPPDAVRRIACDVSIHALFGRKRQALAPEYAERYAAAIRLLESIAAGRLALSGLPVRNLADSTTRGTDKIFSDDSLEEF
jgi:phage gp36-like protein